MAASVRVHLEQGYKTVIEARGLTVIADEPVEDGGTNQGFKPSELLVSALAACAAITCKMYAARKGWNLERIEIEAGYERLKAVDYPTYQGDSDIVHEFQQRIRFIGDLTDDQRTRLLEIAGKCPVHRVLASPSFLVEELMTDEEMPPLPNI
ncbi:MAG: OsmC family protein [bacterium]|nr:OsmC family protein [bacterium]